MDDTILKQMIADAKQCNLRMRKNMGNLPSQEKLKDIKAAAAKGGRNTHRFKETGEDNE